MSDGAANAASPGSRVAPARRIHARRAPLELPGLLQLLFAAELIDPGRRLTLAAPRLEDAPVLDNSADGFAVLEPTWPRGGVPLSRVLAAIAARGTHVSIVTRVDRANEPFLRLLADLARTCGGRLEAFARADLPECGLLGDSYCLSGRLRIVRAGIGLEDEGAVLEVDSAAVAERRLAFAACYPDGSGT